jgi:hypothetical protein
MKTNVKIDFISFKNGLSLCVFYLTRLGPAITYQTQYKKKNIHVVLLVYDTVLSGKRLTLFPKNTLPQS